ncbi:protein SAWADEE HOMEODOMAIN 1 [Tripterygium wilfordii]|uniref:Protein SAWADEE HOMEODOMAIN 1 n=1 Tax=Tripterygium wilfordii TaxID=458696 RepID=A0A7J7BY80_TRIWF|nr:protein SAWADEE HOMEODOMAIN HOMOLOG 1-like [Tripterygium wilfordii]KAF5726860.1 protein SAWADEE HOMEODOMAIN 1 [Tripterygium wilfordii]
MDGSESKDSSASEFSLAEIVEMENIYKDIGENTPNPEICQGIANSFNFSADRTWKPAIRWQEVQSWFQDKQNETGAKQKDSTMALRVFVDRSHAKISGYIPESSLKRRGVKASELSELAFEAKSARDNAWYDVAAFLTYRVMCSGELEVRVRFSGFSNADDEWVNVKRAVRERSIPLEPSECRRVKVGDLVLCFQERPEQAVYCDAYVMEIRRHSHDISGCKCIFVVRYDHDNTKEKVHLERICCRPTS